MKQWQVILCVLCSGLLAWPGVVDAQTLLLSPEERAYLHAHPVILASNELDYPPLDFAINGQPKGYSIDLLNLLADKIGVRVEYVNGYDWEQLVELFRQGKLDVLHSLAKTSEREKLGIYSIPYRRTPIRYVTRTETPAFDDVTVLYGKTVAIGQGWSTQEYLARHHPQVRLLVVQNSEAMLDAVARGTADATVEFADTARYLIKTRGMRNLKLGGWFRASGRWEAQRFYFLVQPDAAILAQLLNRALLSLNAEEMDALDREWFGASDPDPVVPLQPLLTVEERNYLAQKGPLKVCIDPNWMPYEQINAQGRWEGMSADYFALFAQYLGVQFTLHPTRTWQETLDAVRARHCDLISLAAETEDRRAYLNFTRPYLTFPYVIATTRETLFIEDIGRELDKKYAVIKGYVVGEALRRQYPGIRLLEVRDIREGLLRVRSGDVAGYVDASAAIGYALQRDALPDLKIAGVIPIDFQLTTATRNDEPLLQGILQKAVHQLGDKERQQIFRQWIAIRVEQGVSYWVIWQVLAISGLFILAIFFWNRMLERSRQRAQTTLAQLHQLQQNLHAQNQALERMARTDQLTGLANRFQLDAVMAQALGQIHQQRFGLILLDLDHFKQVNDTYGHPVGDQVLTTVATLLRNNVRANDTVGRWGGEEFLIICPNTQAEGAVKVAEYLRARIATQAFPVVGRLTASFGVTVCHADDTLQTLLARADQALYQAKYAGRNQSALLG